VQAAHARAELRQPPLDEVLDRGRDELGLRREVMQVSAREAFARRQTSTVEVPAYPQRTSTSIVASSRRVRVSIARV